MRLEICGRRSRQSVEEKEKREEEELGLKEKKSEKSHLRSASEGWRW